MEHVNLSYWDLHQLNKPVDVLIVGAGITGLSCALRLSQLHANMRIRLVDMHHITRMASTRNAGFACFGSLTEILDDENQFGRDVALNLVSKRYEGIQLIRKTFQSQHIDYHHTGGFELLSSSQWNQDQIEDAIADLSTDLKYVIGSNVFSIVDRATAATFPFDKNVHMVHNPHEGQLNPARFVAELLNLLPKNRVELLSGIEVLDIETNGDFHTINTSVGNMKAHHIVLATNGMTNKFKFNHESIRPARNTVFVTKPNTVSFNGVFHAEQGYIYFRNIGSRLLIGGGRHWDKASEFVDELGVNGKILERLKEYVNQTILPSGNIEIEHAWSGIMGITQNKTPIIEKLSDRLFLAAGFGGMGVALGMHSGFEIAELVSKDGIH